MSDLDEMLAERGVCPKCRAAAVAIEQDWQGGSATLYCLMCGWRPTRVLDEADKRSLRRFQEPHRYNVTTPYVKLTKRQEGLRIDLIARGVSVDQARAAVVLAIDSMRRLAKGKSLYHARLRCSVCLLGRAGKIHKLLCKGVEKRKHIPGILREQRGGG